MAVDAAFPRQYPYAQFWRSVFGLDTGRRKESRRVSRRTFATIVARLKREGLIACAVDRRTFRWKITEKGRKWLMDLDEPTPAKRDGITRLVIFDVPERERRKRDRIRESLAAYGFTQLQKSVWIGDRPLPDGFITFLDELQLRDKVHILSVREKGTLEAN